MVRNFFYLFLFLGTLVLLTALGAPGLGAVFGALGTAIGGCLSWGIITGKNWTTTWRDAPGIVIFFEFLLIGGAGMTALYLLGVENTVVAFPLGFLLPNALLVYLKFRATGEIIY